MILLVSGATATLRGLPPDAPVGHLVTPGGWNDIAEIAASGRRWAADNGYGPRRDGTPGRPDEAALRAMLDRVAQACLRPNARRPLWCVVPDVVGDARATWELFAVWRDAYAARGLPMAYVAQDGQPHGGRGRVPWERIACLFIGGSTAYKESDEARTLARAAKLRGLPVHVGRVNSERRLRLFDNLGDDARGYPLAIDSIDGTQFSMFPDRYIPRWAERLSPQVVRPSGDLCDLPLFAKGELA